MKPCSDLQATDLDGLSCEIHSRAGVRNRSTGAVKVVLCGKDGCTVTAYEHRIRGPVRWHATFTGSTPAIVVQDCIRGAIADTRLRNAIANQKAEEGT